MSNKKGFTLVELLAVIAILAILVIIAMPNVLNMFMNAKKSSFVTEAQNVIKQVTNKYIDESLKGNHISTISNDNNPLDLSGNIKYEIEIDSQGNVTSYIISNDSYCISSSKKYNELTKDDVKDDCSYESLHNIVGTLEKDFYKKAIVSNKAEISNVYFYSDGRVIDNAKSYDVSEKQDNSIIMYVTKRCDNCTDISYANAVNVNQLINLTIVSNGKISLPEDSSEMFSFFTATSSSNGPISNVEKINFNCSVDTSKVTNMSSMFAHSSFYDLDLDCFDTSNVTNMSYMFYRYPYSHKSVYKTIETLDVTSLDTSNVTNMSFMFSNCEATQIKGLEKLNTQNVKNMSNMLEKNKMKVLNISNFNTSKVEDMDCLFLYGYNDEIILGDLDTSNVASMQSMFNGNSVTKIDGLENLESNKLKSVKLMFSNTKKLKEIDLSSFDFTSMSNDSFKDMFKNTGAAKAYAKDEANVVLLNNATQKPSSLTIMRRK